MGGGILQVNPLSRLSPSSPRGVGGSDGALLLLDDDGHIVQAGENAEAVVGWSPGEIVGRDLDEIIRVEVPGPEGTAPGGTGPFAHVFSTPGLAVTREGQALLVGVTAWRGPGGLGRIVLVRPDGGDRLASDLIRRVVKAAGEGAGLVACSQRVLDAVAGATGWKLATLWTPGKDRWRCSARLPGSGAPVQAAAQAYVERAARQRHWRWVADASLAGEPTPEGPAPRPARFGVLVAPAMEGRDVAGVVVAFVPDPRAGDGPLACAVANAVEAIGPILGARRAAEGAARQRAEFEAEDARRAAEGRGAEERLRQAERLAAIGTMAAGLGHDMNNILLPLRCRLDVLEGGAATPPQREAATAVRQALGYLRQLADGLHELAQDNDDADGRTDVGAWWAAHEVLLRMALPRDANLVGSVEPGLPEARIASHRLTQAVLNLVVNAAEAIGHHGRVEFRACRGPGRTLRLCVTDNGRGMSDEVRRRATDPFFTTKKRGLGTGMGLAIVRGIVSGVGGEIEIESEEGKGTGVTLTLHASDGGREPSRRSAVVSIRDERARAMVSAFFGAAGFEVARPGRDASAPPGARIWVTEPTRGAVSAATRFLAAGPGRGVLIYGRPEEAPPGGHVVVVEDRDDFDGIRRAIDRVAALCGGAA